jgi:hypothetical protein
MAHVDDVDKDYAVEYTSTTPEDVLRYINEANIPGPHK